MPTRPPSPRSTASLLWHPTDYFRVLYKRRWVAIPGFLLIFLTGTVNSIRTVPVYEARTQLLIEKDARRATSITGLLQEQDSWYNDDFYPTQHRILMSRALADRTVGALDQQGKPEQVPAGPAFTLTLGSLIGAVRSGLDSWLGSDTASLPAPSPVARADARRADQVDAFLGGLTVVPIRTSRLVDLKFRSPDPDYAQRAANALAEQYIQQVIAFRSEASVDTTSWLQSELDAQRERVLASEQRLQTYRETNDAAAVDNRQNVVVQRLTALTGNVTQAKFELVDKEARFRQLQTLRGRGEALDVLPEVASSEYVQSLKTNIDRLRGEEGRLVSAGFGPSWPDLKQTRDEIATAQANLQAETERIAGGIETAFATAREKVADLERQLAQQQAAAMQIDSKAIEYNALEREAESARLLYDNLLQRVQETGVSSEFQGTNIRVVDEAQYPRYPVLPQKQRDITVAALGGLLLALGLAFGVEYFDSRIKSPDEVKAYVDIPFLGMVPTVSGHKAGLGDAPMMDPDVPPSFSEAIRAVRTAVVFSSAEEGARSIIVTSTGPSEGKTMISSSLAVALAQAGQRTLLVDADMRRPRLHEVLDRSQEPGLSNVLVGEASLTDSTRATDEKNLWLLTAGHLPPNPAELLGSKRFDEVFGDLKCLFDWIVIDAPPVMPVTDSAVLAHTGAGVLFVIGSEMTPRQSVTAALEQLRNANARFVGAVLNKVNVHRHAYYYSPYYRKAYAKYYQRSPNRA